MEHDLCVTAIYDLPGDLLLDEPLAITNALIPAGYPCGEIEEFPQETTLAELLIQNPVATYLVRVEGKPMPNAGILNGDLLVVDRSKEANDGSIVIAALNGRLVIRRLVILPDQIILSDDNPAHPPAVISSIEDETIWGVVTYVIHLLNKPVNPQIS